MIDRREVLKGLAAATLVPAARPVTAQGELVKILVGFAPGTATDALGRMLAKKMKGLYAPSLVVDNRVGASGQLAVLAAKSAPADGSTMLVCAMTVLSVYPHTFAKVGYDPVKDLVPVGNCATADFAFAVGPVVPEQVRTVPQFIEWCKANPAQATFATGATGSKLHFAGIKLGVEAGVKLTHVGYTNGGVALTDLAGGAVPAYVGVVPTVLPFLNRIRVLATMGSRRSRFLPDIPTLMEQGFRNMVINDTLGLYLPPRASQEQVQRLHAAMVKALVTAEAATTLSTIGMEATPSGADETAAQLRAELDQWGRFVRRIGFKQDT